MASILKLRIWRLLIVFLALVIAPISNAADERCSVEKFAAFFSRFSSDPDFSRDRTHWPLRLTTEQFGEPSTRDVKYIMSGSEYWGTEKTVSEFLKSNQRIRAHIGKQVKSRVVVTFAIEDGDILFDLKFGNQNGCWELIEVRDFDR